MISALTTVMNEDTIEKIEKCGEEYVVLEEKMSALQNDLDEITSDMEKLNEVEQPVPWPESTNEVGSNPMRETEVEQIIVRSKPINSEVTSMTEGIKTPEVSIDRLR